MNIKENIITPTKDTVLLGMNDCLGGVTIQELAELINSINGQNSGTVMSYKYLGPGNCATRGNITARGYSDNNFNTFSVLEISIAKEDRQGHDLSSFLTEHLINSTIRLTKVGDPAKFIVFDVNGNFDECNDAYTFGVAYVSGSELEVDAIYELTL